MAIDYIRVVLSFRQAACVLQSNNKHSGLANIGSSSDTTITKYASIACAVNLHKVSYLLEEACKLLVSMDMSTHMSTSYLDVHISMHPNKHDIINLHLIFIHVYESKTYVRKNIIYQMVYYIIRQSDNYVK